MKTASPLVALLLTVVPLRADFANNQPASSVLGKPDFTSTSVVPTAADNFVQPLKAVVDPTTAKVFVLDNSRHRVLRFSSTAAYQTGSAAEGVLGQVGFAVGTANQGGAAGAGTLSNPNGIAVDAAGRLWVADSGNNRVLRFDTASAKGNGAAADGVLGQTNFTATGSATTDNGLNSPGDVFVDRTGSLWVADFLNNRVLRYSSAAERANGAAANQVLGQANFTSAVASLGSAGMHHPNSLFVDSSLRLWSISRSQNRILRFDNAASKGNGGNADAVLGQVDFNSSASTPVTAATLNFPYGCTVTSDGTLWISDGDNHRVLGFKNAATKASGANADFVLGQPSFDTNDVFPATAMSLNIPFGLSQGQDGVLFVADLGFGRVLRFSPTVEITAPARATARNGRITLRGTSKFASTVTFKGAKGGFKRAAGTAANWRANLSGLKRPTTRVPVKAAAFDGRSAQKIVVVKSRR